VAGRGLVRKSVFGAVWKIDFTDKVRSCCSIRAVFGDPAAPEVGLNRIRGVLHGVGRVAPDGAVYVKVVGLEGVPGRLQ